MDEKRVVTDEELLKAAEEADVEVLIDAIAMEKPLTCVVDSKQKNIFHLASHNKGGVKFIREAIKRLDSKVVQTLLCQSDESEWNPFEEAGYRGNNKVVKVMLEFYEKLSLDEYYQPWLIVRNDGEAAFHVFLRGASEECALKLLSIDTRVCDLIGYYRNHWYSECPLVTALSRGFSRVVSKFLELTHDEIWKSMEERVLVAALGYAPACTEEVFQLVLEKHMELIEDEHALYSQLSKDYAPLNTWARMGQLYPFEHVFKNSNDDRIARLRRVLIGQMTRWDTLNSIIEGAAQYDEHMPVQIAKILVTAYKQENEKLLNSGEVKLPWLNPGRGWQRPLKNAIYDKNESLALYFMSLEKGETMLREDDHILFYAIENKCPQVAEKILDLVNEHGITTPLTSRTGRTVLHDAPRCTEVFLKLVLARHPELVTECDENGVNVFHSWIKIGELWPFKCVLESNDIKPDMKKKFVKLLDERDDQRRNPLHLAADNHSSSVEPIVQLLVDAYLDLGLAYLEDEDSDVDPEMILGYTLGPWRQLDRERRSPLRKAILNGRDELALCLLKAQRCFRYYDNISIFQAIENKCKKVVEFILEQLFQNGIKRRYLCSQERNILHVAGKCTEKNGKLMVERWPHFINETDENGKTPLEIAFEEGTSWLVESILQKDRKAILKTPKAWIPACKKGDLPTIITFVEKCKYFRYICRDLPDTPLHHVVFEDYNSYEKLLEFSIIQEMKNNQDSEGDTALHKAIKNRNKDLTEILFTMKDISWNIKNKNGEAALDLLEEVCHQDQEWVDLCKVIGVDPKLKVTYIQRETDLEKMQNNISLVAALLATITFTAGFTLPGGLNSDNGQAVFSKHAAFLVFLIADVYAMCCSMLILFSIIWSMVCDSKKASFIADHSLGLLKHSLYGTLVAFMTGVYLVTYKKSLWIAIVVIVMCSLSVILAQRPILHKMFEIMNFVSDKTHKMRMQLLSWYKERFTSRRKQQPTVINNEDQDEEAPLAEHHESTLDAAV